jgi:general secretion pathway protein F
MPIFEYRAVDAENKQRKGIIDADSPREARIKLRTDRLFVTDIKERRRGGARKVQIRGITGVEAPNKQRNDQVAAVTRQMSSLLRAGIPLAEDRGDLPRHPREGHPGHAAGRRGQPPPGLLLRALREHGPCR